ncbi:hypothetical protein [Sabulicella glaciei]|uniref:DUF4169 family protein n=1 Tax=Sabulicella glaciei TaxID=2984948 RepID=A0ABT3NVL0_9PROT|nr:hypothetical protein [Roseococcus sp. MDT2-1-1]MCW8085599.1 hypothetical protein [Roseococcus sp. MDT2-1-1]
MMRKPNYSMERKDRERAKQSKAAAKADKRAAKSMEDRETGAPTADENVDLHEAGKTKQDGSAAD